MKTIDVEKRVQKIASLIGQKDGAAHVLEDGLYLDVLKAIASGAPNPRKLAEAAIKSADLDISRWYE